MKICGAQTRSEAGNIPKNIHEHIRMIRLAFEHGADSVFFPELSITGYEPSLCSHLATIKEDARFLPFQELSNSQGIIIGMGVPLQAETGTTISMLIFQPGKSVEVYSKKYLHDDEIPFFVPGENSFSLLPIALAICYEISIPGHAAAASAMHAGYYVACVAKSKTGMQKAYAQLSLVAKNYGMPVMIVNSLGPSDNFIACGKSAVWNRDGELLTKAGNREGLIFFDSESEAAQFIETE